MECSVATGVELSTSRLCDVGNMKGNPILISSGTTGKNVASTDVMVVMGDMNAKIGKGSVDRYVGEFGLGERNDSGDRLLEFCIEKDLFVANTHFQQPARRLYTWKSPGDVYRNQIDYIMVRRRFSNSVKNCRTFPGADINSDHCLLVSKMNFRLKKIEKRKIKDQYNLDM